MCLELHCIINWLGPGSSVGVATWLRAGRSGIESRWGRDFPPVQTGPGAHAAPCKMGTEPFPGVKCGRGVLLTTDPLLVPRSWKSRAIISTHPLGHTGPVTGSLYLFIINGRRLCWFSIDEHAAHKLWTVQIYNLSRLHAYFKFTIWRSNTSFSFRNTFISCAGVGVEMVYNSIIERFWLTLL